MDDVFDASQLRPYRVVIDEETLQSDEFVVDELMKRRLRGGVVEFQVKWRGYPKSQSTWEPRSALEQRCNELLEAYDEEHNVAPPTNGLFRFQGANTPNTPKNTPIVEH